MPDLIAKDISATLAENGWLLGIVATAWAFTLRVLIGRHFKAVDAVNVRLSRIEQDLAAIQGRLTERDRFGHHTWPGDSE